MTSPAPILPGWSLTRLVPGSVLPLDWSARSLSLVPRSGQAPTYVRDAWSVPVTDTRGVTYDRRKNQPVWDTHDLDGDGTRDTVSLALGDLDYLTWPWALPMQSLTIYVRGITTAGMLTPGAIWLTLGTPGAYPNLRIHQVTVAGTAQVGATWNPSATAVGVTFPTAATALVVGSGIEVAVTLTPLGALRLSQRVDEVGLIGPQNNQGIPGAISANTLPAGGVVRLGHGYPTEDSTPSRWRDARIRLGEWTLPDMAGGA